MKKLLQRLLQVAFYGSLTIVAVWWFGLEGESPRLLFSSSPAPIPFPEGLLRTVSIDVEHRPLDEVLLELSKQHGVSVHVDQLLIQSGRFTGTETVSLQVQDVPLYGALSLLVRSISDRPEPVVIRVKNGVALVTTEYVWYSTPSNYETRVYPLDVLLSASIPVHESSLGEAIASTIEYESWSQHGPTKYLGVWEAVPGALVVLQTPDVHDQIERLFDYLKRQGRGEFQSDPVEISDPCHVANATLEEKLRRRVDVEFRNRPFAEVLQELANRYGLPVVFDPRLQWPLRPQTDFAFQLRDASLHSVLNLVCKDGGCISQIHHGSILITKDERFYPRGEKCVHQTAVQSLADLTRRLDVDVQEVKTLLEKLRGGGRGIVWDDQLLTCGSSDFVQQINKSIASIREASLHYRTQLGPTSSRSQAITQKLIATPVAWGGLESIRAMGTRLAQELDINVWIDAGCFWRYQQLDVNQGLEWPEAKASVADYFRRDAMSFRFAAMARDEALVLTPPESMSHPAWTSAHVVGHWLGKAEDAETRWEMIRQYAGTGELVTSERFSLGDVVAVNHHWRDSVVHRDALSRMSGSRWPPRGVLHTWHDPTTTTALAAFEFGAGFDELQSSAAKRIADSAHWPFGALEFADDPSLKDIETSSFLPGAPSLSSHLESALDSVISLTLPTHSSGVTFKILDNRALAVIGVDDPIHVSTMLDTIGRQIQQPLSRIVEPVRLDVWNTDIRPDQNAAYLYDVRWLIENTEFNETRLRELIDTVTPPSIVKRYRYAAADVEVLPGFLVVIHEFAVQKSLAKLFSYLQSETVSQIRRNISIGGRPGVSASERTELSECLTTLLDELRRDDDAVCNNFRVWWLGQSRLRALTEARLDRQDISATLIKYLERTLSADNERGFCLTADTLISNDPGAVQVLPFFQEALRRPWQSESHSSLIKLLESFGHSAIPILIGLLDAEDLFVQDAARTSLAQFGSKAVPELLEWFDATKQTEAHLALDAVDPTLATTRVTLLGWEQSEKSELKARAERLRERLKEHGFELEKESQ